MKSKLLIISQIISCVLCVTIANAQKTDSNKIKIFAENYNSNQQLPAVIPVLTTDLKNSLASMYELDRVACEKYVTLILLKVYKSHIKYGHQSYDLREKGYGLIENEILIVFLKITDNYFPQEHIEFLPSSISYKWVRKNRKLLKYEPIKQEYKEIKKLKRGIKYKFKYPN